MIRESLLAFTLMGGANYADFKTTQDAINRGAIEINPVYRKIPMAPVKIAATVIETGVFIHLYKRKSKKAAWIWVGSVVLVNVGIAIHNSRVAR